MVERKGYFGCHSLGLQNFAVVYHLCSSGWWQGSYSQWCLPRDDGPESLLVPTEAAHTTLIFSFRYMLTRYQLRLPNFSRSTWKMHRLLLSSMKWTWSYLIPWMMIPIPASRTWSEPNSSATQSRVRSSSRDFDLQGSLRVRGQLLVSLDHDRLLAKRSRATAFYGCIGSALAKPLACIPVYPRVCGCLNDRLACTCVYR